MKSIEEFKLILIQQLKNHGSPIYSALHCNNMQMDLNEGQYKDAWTFVEEDLGVSADLKRISLPKEPPVYEISFNENIEWNSFNLASASLLPPTVPFRSVGVEEITMYENIIDLHLHRFSLGAEDYEFSAIDNKTLLSLKYDVKQLKFINQDEAGVDASLSSLSFLRNSGLKFVYVDYRFGMNQNRELNRFLNKNKVTPEVALWIVNCLNVAIPKAAGKSSMRLIIESLMAGPSV